MYVPTHVYSSSSMCIYHPSYSTHVCACVLYHIAEGLVNIQNEANQYRAGNTYLTHHVKANNVLIREIKLVNTDMQYWWYETEL